MKKILIYNGPGAAQNGPVNTAVILRNGYQVNYTTKISTELLRGVDVLIIPGGDSGRTYLKNINGDVIKQYVKDGGRLFATCAGAYAASKHVDAPYDYDGWGVAPSVRCKATEYVGNLSVKLEDEKIITLHHYRGPAMYVEQKGTGKILAWFNDNKTGFKSYANIVGDKYGKGKVVLCSSHPELAPQHPEIIHLIMNYLLKEEKDTGDVNVAGTFTKVQIAEAGKRVKAFMEENKRLPNTIKIGKELPISDYLYLAAKLLATGVGNVEKKTVKNPESTNVKFKAGKIVQKDYRDLAKRVSSFIEKEGRAPKYASTPLGDMPYTDLVYTFAKLLNFLYVNGRMPNYVSVTQFGTYTPAKVGPIQDYLQEGTGIKYKNITELYNKILLPYAAYSNPIYYNSEKTLKQSCDAIIANVKGKKAGKVNQNQCVEFSQLIAAQAKEMKEYGIVNYTKFIIWSFRCVSMDINHAVVLIDGGEFKGKTVQLREKQYGPIAAHTGAIVDGAAAAESSYAITKFWCSNTDVRVHKEPSWAPYEKW